MLLTVAGSPSSSKRMAAESHHWIRAAVLQLAAMLARTLLLALCSQVSVWALGLTRTPIQMMFGAKTTGPSIGNKKLCVVTGTTSGLGRETVRALLNKQEYFVVCAVRDTKKMEEVAAKEGFDTKSLKVIELDLASFDSTRKFISRLNDFKKSKKVDRLVCNAAVYQPALPTVRLLKHSRYMF